MLKPQLKLLLKPKLKPPHLHNPLLLLEPTPKLLLKLLLLPELMLKLLLLLLLKLNLLLKLLP